MNNLISLTIIAYHHSPFVEKFGIPRQPNLVDVSSYLIIQPPYDDEYAFVGIEQFSHLWLLWHFHDNKNHKNPNFKPMIRPPRLGGNQKIGVFASRSMYRPSPIGLSVVKFEKLQRVGKELRLYISGADLLHGTPIIDIKPYLAYSDALIQAKSGYAQEAPIPLRVIWLDLALQQREILLKNQIISQKQILDIEHLLSLDPRPAYHQDVHKIYGWAFAHFDIQFQIQQDSVKIIQIVQRPCVFLE